MSSHQLVVRLVTNLAKSGERLVSAGENIAHSPLLRHKFVVFFLLNRGSVAFNRVSLQPCSDD